MSEPDPTELTAAAADTGWPQAEEILALVTSGAADGITIQDATGRVVYANEAAVRLLGFGSAEEMLAADPRAMLGRFEMLDERGDPIAPERLPGRLALAGEQPRPLTVTRTRPAVIT